MLHDVRARYPFTLVGYCGDAGALSSLIGESTTVNPSVVVQVLKQRVSRRLRRRVRGKSSRQQLLLWQDVALQRSFWQRQFYDFNVWSRKKRRRSQAVLSDSNWISAVRAEMEAFR